MKVIVISKNSFNTLELANVSNIAFSSNTYTITAGGVTTTYSADNYRICVIW